MEARGQPSPQPDPQRLAEEMRNIGLGASMVNTASRNLAAEIIHLNNLPAFDQARQFLAAVEGLGNRLEASIRQAEQRINENIENTKADMVRRIGLVQGEVTSANGRLDRINTRIEIMEYNNIARMTNGARARANNASLEPLKGLDNNLIPGFPAVVSDISDLQSLTLSNLLRSLGQPTTGQPPEMMARFKQAIGIHYF